jgi:hypothetical protein
VLELPVASVAADYLARRANSLAGLFVLLKDGHGISEIQWFPNLHDRVLAARNQSSVFVGANSIAMVAGH